MTEQELAAIEKRANAATREPWSVSGTYVPTASLSAVSVYGMGMEVAECQMDTDGTFIAAARVDVPALIAEVRKLTAERDALRVDVRTHVETVSSNIHHESGCGCFDNRKRCTCGTQPAADALRQLLDAALHPLAVQP